MPALATEEKASMAAAETRTIPQGPARRSAARATGVRAPASSSRGTMPTMTNVPVP